MTTPPDTTTSLPGSDVGAGLRAGRTVLQTSSAPLIDKTDVRTPRSVGFLSLSHCLAGQMLP